MPLYGFKCTRCNATFDEVAKVDQTFVYCPHCAEDGEFPAKAEKTLSMFGTYKIKGNNSASVTPRKFRGEK